jgi:integral membrane protein
MSSPLAGPAGGLPLPVRLLSKVAAAEGVSFVLLLVGSVMRRTSSLDPVPVLGMVHGVLYVLLVALVLASLRWLRWGVLFTLLVVTVLSPGAHFPVAATIDQRRARHGR